VVLISENQKKVRDDIFLSPDATCDVRYLVVRDTAYQTYKAVLNWLDTGQIGFRLQRQLCTTKPRKGSFVYVSPKSVYKLAFQIDLPELRKLALEHYATELRGSAAVSDYFAESSLYYPELAEVAERVLLNAPVPL